MVDDYIYDNEYLEYLKKHTSKKEYSNLMNNLYSIYNSDEYRNLLIEYNEYVKSIAELFKSLNVTSTIEVLLLYNYLLNEGIFSTDKWFIDTDTTNQDLLVQTWGSRVATGYAVCRHCTMLLIDIERYLGNYVEAVDIFMINKYKIIDKLLLEKNNRYIINHLVMGFKENNEILIYDPFNSCFLFKNDNLDKKYIDFISIDHDFKYDKYFLYYFINGINDYKLDYNNVVTYSRINKDYLEEKIKKIEGIINNNKNLFNYFHMDNSKKIRQLAYLNEDIINKQEYY